MDYSVKEITCKTALHFHNSKWLPYQYDINVYRGCAHQCTYCYALYSHEYLGGGDFYRDVYAKTNIADVLRRELPRFSRATVNLGGITDSYQPAEREYKLMPGVLKLLARFSVPVTLCTKSPLVLRDAALLKEIDDAGGVKTAFTITTLDETVAKLIEPHAPVPQMRMDALAELKKLGITCGVHMMPVIPFLTNGADQIEAVFSAAKDAGADYLLTGSLNLKGATRTGFFENIRQRFPSEYGKIKEIYRNKNAYSEYINELGAVIAKLRKKYDLPFYVKISEKEAPTQLSFL